MSSRPRMRGFGARAPLPPRVRFGETREGRLLSVAVAASVIAIFFAIPHTTEDFVYHIPRTRFHLNDEFALWLWGGVTAVQAAGIALASARKRVGLVAIAATGAIWVMACLLDHTGDVLFHQPWRDAPSSTIWVLGTVIANLAATACSVGALLAWRAAPARVAGAPAAVPPVGDGASHLVGR